MTTKKDTKQEKNKGGKPLLFDTPEKLEKALNDYFDSITITELKYQLVKVGEDEEGKPIYEQEPILNNKGTQVTRTRYYENPSILAMCRHIGTTRETIREYEMREGYVDTIKKAKARVEEYLENELYRKEQVTGVIFNLKNNFGWKDKQEIETSGETTVNNRVDLTAISTEDLKKMLGDGSD